MKNKTSIKIVAFVFLSVVTFISLFLYRGKFENKKVSIELGNQKTDEVNKADVVKQEDAQNDIPQNIAIREEVASDEVEKLQNESKEVSVENEITQKKIETISTEETKSSDTFKIINKLVDFGYQKSSDRKIDTVVIHSSYDAIGKDPFSVSGIIKEYEDYNVSAHYLIDRDGYVYRLVEEKNIAWHAGVAKVPDGRTNVNSFSVGIEMINTKADKFTSNQYSSLNKLLTQLKTNYDIKYILGHNQVAPNRKDDPWNIDWDKVKK